MPHDRRFGPGKWRIRSEGALLLSARSVAFIGCTDRASDGTIDAKLSWAWTCSLLVILGATVTFTSAKLLELSARIEG